VKDQPESPTKEDGADEREPANTSHKKRAWVLVVLVVLLLLLAALCARGCQSGSVVSSQDGGGGQLSVTVSGSGGGGQNAAEDSLPRTAAGAPGGGSDGDIEVKVDGSDGGDTEINLEKAGGGGGGPGGGGDDMDGRLAGGGGGDGGSLEMRGGGSGGDFGSGGGPGGRRALPGLHLVSDMDGDTRPLLGGNPGALGSEEWAPGSVGGNVYFIDELRELPDLTHLTPLGALFLHRVDMMPGKAVPAIGGRTAHYALDYRGVLRLKESKTLYFRLSSDDGARLSIDQEVVVDNDGRHGIKPRRGKISLAAGLHEFQLEYFQADSQAHLVLEVSTGPDNPYEIFDTRHFLVSEDVETPDGSAITIDAGLVFQGEKCWHIEGCLARLADDGPLALVELFVAADRQPNTRVVVEGHSTGDHALARSRGQAEAVARWLRDHGIAGDRIAAVGHGEDQPNAGLPERISVRFEVP